MVANTILLSALDAATAAADAFRGATAPNPPVGAAALDASGEILSVQAHARAGLPHAEALLIANLQKRGLLERTHTVVVTLEPCNHYGKTPPCSEALLKLPALKRVAYAAADPNPQAQGGGERLRSAGIEVLELSSDRARALTRPFFHWIKTGRPWVTVKTVWRNSPTLTMLPPPGQKTFSSPSSLKLAHELRRRADAILTGSGTVLADLPEFTVRHVPDHAEKQRWLVVLDRRGRTPLDWQESRRRAGFRMRIATDFREILTYLGTQGVLEVLVEAGPTLSRAILQGQDWNEHIRIFQAATGDRVENELRITQCSLGLLKKSPA